MSELSKFPRVEVQAAAAGVASARLMMRDIRDRTPEWREGYGPTAEDNCRYVLDMVQHGLVLLDIYLAEGVGWRPRV